MSRLASPGLRVEEGKRGSRTVRDSWWARDKRLHIVASAASVGVSYHILHDRWHQGERNSREVGFSLTALMGLIKEVKDLRKAPSIFSYKDLIADGLGIGVGIYVFTR
jgi:uncharacterized protein YfiM (DUF2279 family)